MTVSTGETRPEISVIVVNWNTADLLRRCLESIYDTITTLRFEVVLVDNGSTDGSVEMVGQEFPSVRLIRNAQNRGFAAANNQGIKASRGRQILLLNSDAKLLPNAAATMHQCLAEDDRVAIVGARLLNLDGSFQASYHDFPRILTEFLALTGLSHLFLPSTWPSYPEEKSGERREVDWVSGACLMARRGAIDNVGLLDEDYFMYSEEMDWCYRMKRAGWKIVFVPEATALHGTGASARKAPERRRAQVYQSKCIFFRKHRGATAATFFRNVVWLATALKLLAWLPATVLPASNLRRRGHENLASYRFLLTHT